MCDIPCSHKGLEFNLLLKGITFELYKRPLCRFFTRFSHRVREKEKKREKAKALNVIRTKAREFMTYIPAYKAGESSTHGLGSISALAAP